MAVNRPRKTGKPSYVSSHSVLARGRPTIPARNPHPQ
jgi:hypothetical protein